MSKHLPGKRPLVMGVHTMKSATTFTGDVNRGAVARYAMDDRADFAAPEAVNPSLWRQSQLLKREGLDTVVDGLFQVRFGGANLTIAGQALLVRHLRRNLPGGAARPSIAPCPTT